ncbi:MAG TPA: hypothetical protein VD947_03370 [Patescibacteria group bacterium]|nr:hypothetical protein [Patescibacteria group bacterium]
MSPNEPHNQQEHNIPEQPQSPSVNPYLSAPEPQTQHKSLSAGLVVLQWLTYAFWGWTVLALSFLTSTVIANIVDESDSAGLAPYAIAAVLVLLPISYICDAFYSKREPKKKTGAEMLVMVVHAVIFALFGIGSLIFAVFAIVMLLTESTNSKDSQIGLYSALIIAVFYALTFLRTLNPVGLPWVKRWYKMAMFVSVGAIGLLGLIGPVAEERSRRDDKLLENELYVVKQSIDNYARSNDRLPDSLEGLEMSEDAEKIVDKKLVEYKPQASKVTGGGTQAFTEFRYELCVNYKKESNHYEKYGGYYDYAPNKDEYTDHLSNYTHPAGEVCYKLKASQY